MTLGLFFLIEVRSARVADPDELTARVRVGVIGVVPPLPSPQPARSPRACATSGGGSRSSSRASTTSGWCSARAARAAAAAR